MKNKEYKHGIVLNGAGVKKCRCGNYFNGNKFCSHKCYTESKVGEKHSWGDKISKALKGVPKSPEHIKNAHEGWLKANVQLPRGEKHGMWKGNSVGYDALHDWVRRYKGAPKSCEECGIEENRTYHWANKSGKYLRELDDWIRLCVPCHSKLDKSRPYSYRYLQR